MGAARAHINGGLLRWAREKAGLSPEEAAARANINSTRIANAGERLLAWEASSELPTPSQLKALARVYHRPVLTFYLSKPPSEDQQLADFRTISDAPIGELSPELDALLRRLRARQSQVRDILLDDGAEALPVVGRFGPDVDAKTIAADMRSLIGIRIQEQMKISDKDTLFRLLRNRLENLGLFVQIVGDLGSHHTSIQPEEFRGIALADDVAPFIAINANDSRAAFPFTLIHEAAHVWMGASGISNASPFGASGEGLQQERLCNEVAAEFLLPLDDFLISWGREQYRGDLPVIIAILSREWKVSRAAVANRLWKHNEISDDAWWRLYRSYQIEWQMRKDRQKEQDGGPTYYITTKSRLGNALIRTVLNAVDAGSVTYTQASRILNVKTKSFDGLRDGGF